MIRKSNKRPVETFVVMKTGTAIYNAAGAGNNITNSSGNIVLADGQLGLFDATGFGSTGINVALDATPTVAESPTFYIAQGTQWSAAPATASNTYPLWNEPYVRTAGISASGSVGVTKKPMQPLRCLLGQ